MRDTPGDLEGAVDVGNPFAALAWTSADLASWIAPPLSTRAPPLSTRAALVGGLLRSDKLEVRSGQVADAAVDAVAAAD